MKNLLLTVITMLCLASCAGKYTKIYPSTLRYDSEARGGIVSGTRQNVLATAGNKKYTKKEDRKGISVIAVKIENTTERSLTFGEDIQLYSGNRQIIPLEPNLVYSQLKQGVGAYLLYLLLTPLNIYSVNSQGDVTNVPAGLILGPGLSAGNMLGASGANQNFKMNLEEANLINMAIPPGETRYGLVGIQSSDLGVLSIRVVNNKSVPEETESQPGQ